MHCCSRWRIKIKTVSCVCVCVCVNGVVFTQYTTERAAAVTELRTVWTCTDTARSRCCVKPSMSYSYISKPSACVWKGPNAHHATCVFFLVRSENEWPRFRATVCRPVVPPTTGEMETSPPPLCGFPRQLLWRR